MGLLRHYYRISSRKNRVVLIIGTVVPSVLVLCSVTGVVRSTEVIPENPEVATNPNTQTPISVKAVHTESEQSSATKHPRRGLIVSTPLDNRFLGRNEQVILDKLINNTIVKVRGSPGGRSIAFRLTLRDGTRAFYKPEQTFSAAHWNAEVVSYYLDRSLGIQRVPPTVSRSLPWAKLSQVAASHPRKNEVVIGEDGKVKGALIFWLPKRLVPLETPPGWENWIRIEQWPKWKISPYQRPKVYVKALATQRINRHKGKELSYFYYRTPEPDRPVRGAELSDMLVFDFLTLNIDRFGGKNCNILLYGNKGPLIFLDNGAGFSPGPPRRNLMDIRLKFVQRFRRRTIDALRSLDMEKFRRRLERDRLAPLLSEADLKGLDIRRKAVLDRVAKLQKRFRDHAVLPW